MSRRRTVVLTNSLDKLVSFSEIHDKIQSSFPGKLAIADKPESRNF